MRGAAYLWIQFALVCRAADGIKTFHQDPICPGAGADEGAFIRTSVETRGSGPAGAAMTAATRAGIIEMVERMVV